MTKAKAALLVRCCEDRLGWLPTRHPRASATRARHKAAEELLAAVGADPRRPSFAELELAVAYLQHRRQPLRSPAQLLAVLDQAKALGAVPQVASDLERRIEAALELESGRGLAGQLWITRLTRALGPARAEVYRSWLAEQAKPLAVGA